MYMYVDIANATNAKQEAPNFVMLGQLRVNLNSTIFLTEICLALRRYELRRRNHARLPTLR